MSSDQRPVPAGHGTPGIRLPSQVVVGRGIGRSGVSALAVVLALAMALATAAPVLGHAELESSDPADGATLAAPPTTITLTFSEGLNASESRFELDGPDGSAIGTGKAAQDGAATMTLDGLALAPGGYSIKWTSVSLDTDILRGTLTFTVSEPAPTAAPAASPTTPDSPASADAGSNVVLPIVIGLLLVAGVGAYVLRRSRSAGR